MSNAISMGMACPNLMTPDIENQIITLLYDGKNITEVTKILGISISTINKHRIAVPLFDEQVSRARKLNLDAKADQLETIADTYDDVNKARLKSDNLKWLLSRLDPAQWGDKIDLNVTNTVNIRDALDSAIARTRQVIELTPKNQIELTGSKPVETNEGDILTLDELLE